jgi:hypothetical protein
MKGSMAPGQGMGFADSRAPGLSSGAEKAGAFENATRRFAGGRPCSES